MNDLYPCLRISSLSRLLQTPVLASAFNKKSSEIQLTPQKDSRNLATPYTNKTHKSNFSHGSLQVPSIMGRSELSFHPGNDLRQKPVYKLEGTETTRDFFLIKSYCPQPSLCKNKIITKELHSSRSIDEKSEAYSGKGHTFAFHKQKEMFKIPTKVIRFGNKVLRNNKKMDNKVNAILKKNEVQLHSHNHSSSVNLLTIAQSSSLLGYAKAKSITNMS